MCKKLSFSGSDIEDINRRACARRHIPSKGAIIDIMEPILENLPKPTVASAADVWAAMMELHPLYCIRYGRVRAIMKEMFPPNGLKYRKNKAAPAIKCGPVTHRANAWAFIIR